MSTALKQSILNLLDVATANNVAGADTLRAAFEVAAAAAVDGIAPNPSCGCDRAATAPQVGYNDFRTLLKEDTPGFTNESLTAVLHSEGERDVIVVHACNKYRELHRTFTIKVLDGMRVDRATVKAQLKLGVLKVTGRTYRSSTPIAAMNLSDKAIPVTMA